MPDDAEALPLVPSLGREMASATTFTAVAGLFVALLVGVASLIGINDPAIYARETLSWGVQGIAQDWVDLLVVVPWLVVMATATLHGSRRASLLLGAGLAFTAYSFVLYAFQIHFNQLFLIYCAILGLSVYALIGLALSARAEVPLHFDHRAPRRGVSAILIGSAAAFSFAWLAEEVPSAIRAQAPASLAIVGLPSNGIHVLDLALVLPAMVVIGVLVWRRRPSGAALAVIALGFAVLMDINIAAISVAMAQLGLGGGGGLAAALMAIAAINAVALGLLLRACRGTLGGTAQNVWPENENSRA